MGLRLLHSWCFCLDLVWEWKSSDSFCRWRPLRFVSSTPVLWFSGQNTCTAGAAAYQRYIRIVQHAANVPGIYFDNEIVNTDDKNLVGA